MIYHSDIATTTTATTTTTTNDGNYGPSITGNKKNFYEHAFDHIC